LLEKIPVKRLEDCSVPLVVAATNLTLKKEEVFTSGPLIDIVQASGSVPMLFKPVEINGSLYVDGGMVDKAPVQALYDAMKPERIIIHFIASDNLKVAGNEFNKKKMTPWHIHHLSINISRQEAYQRQCDAVKRQGIEIIEVETDTPNLGPNTLERGPAAYSKAKETTTNMLTDIDF
ncbi:patatin-like phospholipase family protein, partial [Thermodesulfobacteriota bacterium]